MKKFLWTLLLCLTAWSASAKVVRVFCFYAGGTNSFYEDESVRISIDGQYLNILNKTDKVLFVDKGSSFQTMNGRTSSLYTNASYTNGSSQGRGASVNVGSVANALGVGGGLGRALNGVSVGGGTTTLNSTTVYEQRFIALAPHTKYTLHIWVSTFSLGIGEGCTAIYNRLGNGKTIRPRKVGRYWNFSPNDSPIRQGAYITYAFKEDFSDAQGAGVEDYIYYIKMGRKNGTVAALGENDLLNKNYISVYEGMPTGLTLLIGGTIGMGAGLIALLCAS